MNEYNEQHWWFNASLFKSDLFESNLILITITTREVLINLTTALVLVMLFIVTCVLAKMLTVDLRGYK